MGKASRRKWTKRRQRYRLAKTVTQKRDLEIQFGHDKRFWRIDDRRD